MIDIKSSVYAHKIESLLRLIPIVTFTEVAWGGIVLKRCYLVHLLYRRYIYSPSFLSGTHQKKIILRRWGSDFARLQKRLRRRGSDFARLQKRLRRRGSDFARLQKRLRRRGSDFAGLQNLLRRRGSDFARLQKRPLRLGERLMYDWD